MIRLVVVVVLRDKRAPMWVGPHDEYHYVLVKLKPSEQALLGLSVRTLWALC